MPDNCKHWQGLLAEHVLASSGRDEGPVPTMAEDLAEHLAGCSECQATASDFASTTDALAHTTAPTAAHVSPPSAGLSARISARVDLARRRRDRHRRMAVVAAVAAVAVLVVSVMTIRHQHSTEAVGERVALSAAGVSGDATLEARSWGTQIRLAVTGFVPGQHYNVWLERSDGTRVGAGSFIGVRDSQITVALSSALQSSEAVAIGISKSDSGSTVVRASLA